MKKYIRATINPKHLKYVKDYYPDIDSKTLEAISNINWLDDVDHEDIEIHLDLPIDFNKVDSIGYMDPDIQPEILDAYINQSGNFTSLGFISGITEVTYKDGSVEYWGWKPYSSKHWVDMTDFILSYDI